MAPQFIDIVARVWDLLDNGKNDDARQLHERILPGLVLEQLFGYGFSKEILVRRGVLRNARLRIGGVFSTDDMREIDACWRRIEPLVS
jgi:4-hydroxy-tetrahydrodipicolinate synthase